MSEQENMNRDQEPRSDLAELDEMAKLKDTLNKQKDNENPDYNTSLFS